MGDSVSERLRLLERLGKLGYTPEQIIMFTGLKNPELEERIRELERKSKIGQKEKKVRPRRK